MLPETARTRHQGLTWIPDDVFVASGFRDAKGKAYAPADYPDQRGLFVPASNKRDAVLGALRTMAESH